MSTLQRKINEVTISIDIQGEQKLEATFPVEFGFEGDTLDDIDAKTQKLRKKLLNGLEIYFTKMIDITPKSEKNNNQHEKITDSASSEHYIHAVQDADEKVQLT